MVRYHPFLEPVISLTDPCLSSFSDHCYKSQLHPNPTYETCYLQIFRSCDTTFLIMVHLRWLKRESSSGKIVKDTRVLGLDEHFHLSFTSRNIYFCSNSVN